MKRELAEGRVFPPYRLEANELRLSEKDRDDECAFRKSGDEQRLHEHFAGSSGVAAHGFTSLESDEAEGDGCSESRACDCDVSCHIIGGVIFSVLESLTVFAMIRIPKVLMAGLALLFVMAHE